MDGVPSKNKMKNEVHDDEPTDFFPLNDLSVQMQLGMYEYLDGWTSNELRKVDKLRRQIVDANPRIFEKKRLIPRVVIDGDIEDYSCKRTKWSLYRLTYMDYCKFCKKRSNRIVLYFDLLPIKCVAGTKYCDQCDSIECCISSTSPCLSLTLEECCDLITKGLKIKRLRLNYITWDLAQDVKSLIDSSLHLELMHGKYGFGSTEWFMNLLQGPRGLTLHEDEYMMYWKLIDDEFYRTAGYGTLEVFHVLLPLTDKQLAILVGRNDLTVIRLERTIGITAEGVRRAVQILLHSSPKKVNIKFVTKNDSIGLESTLQLDAELTKVVRHEDGSIGMKYKYGSGKMEVYITVVRSCKTRSITMYITSHEV